MTRCPVSTFTSAMPTSCTFVANLVKLVDWQCMSIKFNHTIVAARDKKQSATFLTELFGLPNPEPFGPFLTVTVANEVSLDYAEVPEGQEIRPQHYAFLVSEDDSTPSTARSAIEGMEHWADPRGTRPGEINHNDGGRGVYFQDPGGHLLGGSHPAVRVGRLSRA